MAQHKWIFPLTKVILLLWSTLLGLVKAAVPFNSADRYLAPTLGKFSILQRHNDDLVQNLLIKCIPIQGQTLGRHSIEEVRFAKNYYRVWGLTILHPQSRVVRMLRTGRSALSSWGGSISAAFKEWVRFWYMGGRGQKSSGAKGERQEQRPEAEKCRIWPQSSKGASWWLVMWPKSPADRKRDGE